MSWETCGQAAALIHMLMRQIDLSSYQKTWFVWGMLTSQSTSQFAFGLLTVLYEKCLMSPGVSIASPYYHRCLSITNKAYFIHSISLKVCPSECRVLCDRVDGFAVEETRLAQLFQCVVVVWKKKQFCATTVVSRGIILASF